MDTTLNIRILRKSELSPAENAEVERIDRISFHDMPDDGLVWSAGDWVLIGSVAGQVVAITSIVDRMAQAGGQSVRLGGIGGVATLPEWRNRGFARSILQAAAVFMRDELGVDFGLLVCSAEMVPYYARSGWQSVPGPMQFDQPDGTQVTWKEETMVLPCRQQAWPAGAIDLCGLPW